MFDISVASSSRVHVFRWLLVSAVFVSGALVVMFGQIPLISAQDDPGISNVAVNVAASASQSTTSFGGAAGRAVDGNTSGVWSQRSVTHTSPSDPLPWWQVDLGGSFDVDEVVLWNRTNCCSGRLADFTVFVSEEPFADDATIAELTADPDVVSVFHPGVLDGVSVSFDFDVAGRYVRVQKPGGSALSLAEVQVFDNPEVTSDVAVLVLGDPEDTGEGSSTTDLSGNTQLTIASGTFHSNGDLKVQNPSRLISEQSVTAVRDLICTNPNDPLCLPDQADVGPTMSDPLADLPGAPLVGAQQQWPNCNSTCTVEPGRYTGPYNINSNVEYLLAPGYYQFAGQIMNLNGTLSVDPNADPHPEAGAGVMLFFEASSQLEIGSQGSLQFDPPEGGPYENVAIYYDRSNTHTLGWRASLNDMPGWVYAQNGHLRLNNDNSGWVSNNRFVVHTLNSQGGNYTIDPDGWDGWTGTTTPEPPFEPDIQVTPIFECFVEDVDGTFTAYFGYENLTVGEDGSPIAIDIALGEDNNVTPANFDGVQPTSFTPGRTAPEDAEPNAFVISDWDGTEIVWTLDGSTATAGLTTNCASQPPLGPDCFGVQATIVGTDDDDVLIGTEGDDVIFAGLGNDVVDGLGGDDLICGEEGEDILNGDGGADRIDGGSGHDVLDGGADDDELVGGDGDDVILGGAGADAITSGDGDDAIRGGAGDDSIIDNDPTHIDRDSIDGGEGTNVCDGDLDDEEVAC